jgi:hypothetical protein
LLDLFQIPGKEKNGAIKAGSRHEIDDASKSQISIKKQAKVFRGIVAYSSMIRKSGMKTTAVRSNVG